MNWKKIAWNVFKAAVTAAIGALSGYFASGCVSMPTTI